MFTLKKADLLSTLFVGIDISSRENVVAVMMILSILVDSFFSRASTFMIYLDDQYSIFFS